MSCSRSSGGLALPTPLRSLSVLALTAALTYLNFRGLHLVGLSRWLAFNPSS